MFQPARAESSDTSHDQRLDMLSNFQLKLSKNRGLDFSFRANVSSGETTVEGEGCGGAKNSRSYWTRSRLSGGTRSRPWWVITLSHWIMSGTWCLHLSLHHHPHHQRIQPGINMSTQMKCTMGCPSSHQFRLWGSFKCQGEFELSPSSTRKVWWEHNALQNHSSVLLRQFGIELDATASDETSSLPAGYI